jgi:hypothetical protein
MSILPRTTTTYLNTVFPINADGIRIPDSSDVAYAPLPSVPFNQQDVAHSWTSLPSCTSAASIAQLDAPIQGGYVSCDLNSSFENTWSTQSSGSVHLEEGGLHGSAGLDNSPDWINHSQESGPSASQSSTTETLEISNLPRNTLRSYVFLSPESSDKF